MAGAIGASEGSIDGLIEQVKDFQIESQELRIDTSLKVIKANAEPGAMKEIRPTN
jgi:hypothetical protein